MDISVIISTYNRCESLRRTLSSLCDVLIPEGVQWELLVMDNNSRDLTPQVCAEFVGKIPIRYIHEPRQGKSHALNHALTQAHGELLLFTDDDVDVDNNWLGNYWTASQRYPNALFFGGKVVPRWEKSPPPWLEHHSGTLLAALSLNWDLGISERRFSGVGDAPAGANMAFRSTAFQSGLRFRPDLGPMAVSDRSRQSSKEQKHFDSTSRRATKVWTNGEDADFIERLQITGAEGVYIPSAIIHHRNSADRMTERYLRNYYKRIGMTEVRRGEIPMRHLWFGVPRHIWWKFVTNFVKYAVTRLTGPARTWIRAEQSMATCWGVIQESRARGCRGEQNEQT